MLVLSRKQNEIITVGDNIRIKVIEIKGGAVRIGIDAPPDIAVDRLELHEVKKARRRALE